MIARKAECRSSSAIYLYLLCVMLPSSIVCATDALSDEHRLFFTSKERELLDSSAAHLEVNKKNPPKSLSRKKSVENDSVQISNPSSTIFFNGLLESRKSIQVLVNGLPCQSLLLSDTNVTDSLFTINCPHLETLPFGILLKHRTRQVIVQLDDLVKARLSPGEAF